MSALFRRVELAPDSAIPFWVRVAAFVAFCVAASALYYWWRPPAPMLGLRHIEHMGRESNEIALTFDDGPHPLSTPLLLASLEKCDARGSFFIVGEGLRLYPELAHRIVAEGHVLENHSGPHHNLTTVDASQFDSHISAPFAAIEKVEQEAGFERQTRLFRPPGGGLDRRAMSYLYRKGITLAWWSNNVGDWTCPPAWKIASEVKANLKGGDIILLHDGGTGTPQAVPAIIEAARDRGLEVVLMPSPSF